MLAGKRGLIVGAAGGMGRAAALRCALAGAAVACAARDLGRARAAALEIVAAGGSAIACALDIRDVAATRRAVDGLLPRLGGLDFVVNFAGLWDGAGIAEIDEAAWDLVLDVNLRGSFFLCQAVAPPMVAQRSGRIVLIGSIAARIGGQSGGPHYAAAKGGLISLGRALARRLGEHGITVNVIDPGAVETPMTAGWPSERKAAIAKGTPAGRLGQPEDIAGVAAFLVSDAAGWINGQTIEVNGGYYFG